ncbi:XdhC family protein [Kribbella pittospori]|uniref:XdhC family protein n=1 Tax=Kribbella pittospori TaxID=722689 RepID=UPI001EDE8AD2|nr:XdhC family protein [Kribbella pittospori]
MRRARRVRHSAAVSRGGRGRGALAAPFPRGGVEQGLVDRRSVLCVLTHDPKFDVPLLEVALRTDAGYIGAMGSRRTHEDRLSRLRAAGVTEAELTRLSSPTGLDLGAHPRGDRNLHRSRNHRHPLLSHGPTPVNHQGPNPSRARRRGLGLRRTWGGRTGSVPPRRCCGKGEL